MIHDRLIRAVAAAFMFLEASGPDEVNPDSAVRCMENMASSLLDLSLADQLELRRVFNMVADEFEVFDRTFIRALPDMIGLASP